MTPPAPFTRAGAGPPVFCNTRLMNHPACAVLAAAMIVGCASAAAQEDARVTLIRMLGLVGAQRDSLDGTAGPLWSRGGKYAGLKECIDTKATDERLLADLVPIARTALPTEESARPVIAFVASDAGRKFSAGVARRNRAPASEALGRPMPGHRPLNFAGVVLYSDELSDREARDIDAFLRSEEGKPLRALLQSTMGFAQLTRTIAQMNALAAECGIDMKPGP
jgi:hypothetical protein